MVIDHKLSWNNHIDYITNKLSKAASVLSKVRHYVNKLTLLKLYYSCAYPHFKYGIITWSIQIKSLIGKTQVIQNKIIRIINFKCLHDRVKMNKLCKSMNILQIKDIHDLEMSKLMHSYYHKKPPEVFNNYFKSADKHHHHVTRSISKKNYFLQRMDSQCGQSSYFFTGTKIGNNIPLETKLLSKFTFNTVIKKNLIDKYSSFLPDQKV